MNTNNVFIGVTSNNEELLLYLESPDKLINLITEEYVDTSNIKIDNLFLNGTKYQLKSMIIRKI